MVGETVYIITDPELGWNCLRTVLSSEEKVKEWFKTNTYLNVTDINNSDQYMPYVVFKEQIR
jgi:hypothetical protein